MSILIVDDDFLIRNAIVSSLNKSGYSVLSTNNGNDALKLIKESSIQIVMIDWMMPGIDGIELITRIRNFKEPIYIIMLTSKEDTNASKIAFNAGANEFITKPLNIKEVCKRIKDWSKIIDLEKELLKYRRSVVKTILGCNLRNICPLKELK